MTAAVRLPLAFRIGTRTLVSVRRTLKRVPLSLDDALAGRAPVLTSLDGADGYLVTSLPAARLNAVAGATACIVAVRQRYTRYYADLTIGFDAWWQGLSGNTRSGLKRKAKRIAGLKVRSYRTPAELEAFHAIARGIAEKTYQERLMGAGLPADADFVRDMLADAAAGTVRAWLLFTGRAAVAYLYCPVRAGTVIYEYVGHDPAFGELSPGAVLQMEAMRDLFAESGLTRFDFTEGEGQHKRSMATGGVECLDLLLLRPTLANRAVVAGLSGFDRAVALAKAGVQRAGLQEWARKVRRG
ncbi:GNAT family N-acetyltransferase [Sphingomonas sp.]|uniref:GNAT family N-acetyltransferase n=1 Tax=Sphingomonas sp. TaxID=28214 RepID=UPI002C83A0E2|nr:GNAT family N-acetyltransferase [Sphingomonas sp.]HWK35725.1 GNAT family N-acetyltransferase [Sphingomonas sp.]